MLEQFVFTFLVIVLLLAILVLFVLKAGLQLQYLRLKKNKKAGEKMDILQFDYSNSKERQVRLEAFMMFPLMFPIVLDETKQELNALKRKVKSIHIGIYSILIVLIIMAIYSEKVFPAT